MFGAFVYPSREGLPEYLAYRHEVEALVERINERWATDGWTPVIYDASDNFPRSVAALRRYDALLVNPVRDGLNLVAKEGPLLNERDGGAAAQPGGGGLGRAGRRGAARQPLRRRAAPPTRWTGRCRCRRGERAAHARALTSAAAARTPAHWLADQLAAAVAI